jgi:hypothetical protein
MQTQLPYGSPEGPWRRFPWRPFTVRKKNVARKKRPPHQKTLLMVRIGALPAFLSTEKM